MIGISKTNALSHAGFDILPLKYKTLTDKRQ